MQYRVNPKTGARVSALGLGCMRFPRTRLGALDMDAACAIIARAHERGINYLDTAWLYPGNEACAGEALEKLGLRDEFLIATKLPHASCHAPEDFDRFLTTQLKRLRTDHIDQYLIHNVTSFAQWERLVALGIEEWVSAQKEAGRIRAIGFSYHGSAGEFAQMLDAYPWDFCQIQYNYANEHYQAGTEGLKEAAARGIAVIVMEPLLGGRLAGRLPAAAEDIFAAAPERTLVAGEAAIELATPAAWALSWIWDHPEVTCVLSGMTSADMVDANADVADVALPGSLTPSQHETVAQVLTVFEAANRVPCTGCNYCMPCPRGINIPGCFSAYNASFAHGWFTGVFQYVTAAALRSASPKLASQCVRCGACTRHCPQHIDIPDRLVDVRHRLTPGPIDAALKLFAATSRTKR